MLLLKLLFAFAFAKPGVSFARFAPETESAEVSGHPLRPALVGGYFGEAAAGGLRRPGVKKRTAGAMPGPGFSSQGVMHFAELGKRCLAA